VIFNDDLRVRARLSAPGYFYLIALNPNGELQLCHPSKKTDPRERSEELVYPRGDEYFPLTDGEGLQAFLLLVSRAPLPAFDDWPDRAGLPWQAARSGAAEVWRFDGRALEPVARPDRGEPRPRSSAPRPFKEVCDYVARMPQIDAVEAIAFRVMPKF
jgi:hypothetical protein